MCQNIAQYRKWVVLMSSPEYTYKEELANSISHGLGVLFGVVALAMLLIKSYTYQADTLTLCVSMGVYGASIIVLFLASTCCICDC